MSSVAEPIVSPVDATATARGPTEGPMGATTWMGPRTAGTPTLAMSTAVARAAALDSTVGLLVERPDSVALKTKLDQLEGERDRLAVLVEATTARLAAERETAGTASEVHEETISALAEWLKETRIGDVLTFERRLL